MPVPNSAQTQGRLVQYHQTQAYIEGDEVIIAEPNITINPTRKLTR